MIIDMAGDPVPNIRFNTAKTLAKVGQLVGRENLETILAVLDTLVEDADVDVRFYAKNGKEELSSLYTMS